MVGMKMVPAKSTWELGQNSPKHMAAGLENTALMASRGAAIPTPPMAREMGPTPMMLSPLVARAATGTRRTKSTSMMILAKIPIGYPPPYYTGVRYINIVF
jgi:hypothetical protein